VTCQCITRQRLDKHPAIRARNNTTNVYSSLGNSQRANKLAGYKSRDVFCRSAPKFYRGQQRSLAGSRKLEE
jgi:hypothetical protein